MAKAMLQILTLLILLPSPVPAQAQLEFAPLPASYKRVLLLPNGNRVFVGTVEAYWILNPSTTVSHIALSVTGPAPYGPFPVLGGSGNDIPSDAAVDGNGNLWIVGSTDSDDLRVVNPIYGHKEPYRTAGFVIELDATGTSVLFSTYIGGQF